MQMKFNKAIQYQMYPTDEQIHQIHQTFGCVRFVWNHMLQDSARFLSETDVAFVPTPAKYKTEYPFLKEVDSLALANAQLHLKSAYKAYFKDKKVGFPNYKSKKSNRKSYTTNLVSGNIVLGKTTLRLPKLGEVKIKKHRIPEPDWVLKGATVDYKNGKYSVSVLFEYQKDIQPVEPKEALGLDYSSPHFYVDSNGNKANYPRFYRASEAKLAKEQRKLSKMKHGSSHYEQQNRKVTHLQSHIANQRKDFQHKLSTEIANRYDVVCVEDLNLHDQAQTLHFGKAVGDNGFGQFRNMLAYKLMERGKYFVVIDKWFASTKTCRFCGYKKKNLTLKDRTWTCPACGAFHDRDTNAAINIKEEGLRMLKAS